MFKKLLNRLYFIYETFAYKSSLFATVYLKFHEPSVEKEIEMAQITASDHVLHIGCGAIPYTSAVLVRKCNMNIVSIDNKQKIVDNAINFVKQHGLSNKINLKRGDGKTYDVSGFDVVIISYGVAEQDMVLRHVINSVQAGSRIILRRSTTKKSEYIDSIIEEFSICSKRLLLTQKSILIIKR